jgi:putative ABC transport system permease protein
MQQALALGLAASPAAAALLFSVKDAFPRACAAGAGGGGGLRPGRAICLLASLLGVRAALRIEPAQALGG